MKLLVWAFLFCLICNGVNGFFFDGLSQIFGGTSEETTVNPINSIDATSREFIDEMEDAANNLNGVWQQFRKELLNLMTNFSSSDDNDGHKTSQTANLEVTEENSTEDLTPTLGTPIFTTNINIVSTTKPQLSPITPLP